MDDLLEPACKSERERERERERNGAGEETRWCIIGRDEGREERERNHLHPSYGCLWLLAVSGCPKSSGQPSFLFRPLDSLVTAAAAAAAAAAIRVLFIASSTQAFSPKPLAVLVAAQAPPKQRNRLGDG
ncbi:uncharacterized protein ARB_05389 [Trichophyton benhamiae CBS 112371]|uniref:Uncharacterized protein n=1 Tax=Arthroderma benhamiae (strain ATCC MYA-4681 / CBS 112371) TaxID=663331 RepID=D4AMD6_ARTBC|nr:uncharacterized protein ARB_05389 [Trichophyton benhamiae CBS 112371]EFE35347.1 hypothetical protein ARB_05389 [Trichophyton benhamiae CBS 112371]